MIESNRIKCCNITLKITTFYTKMTQKLVILLFILIFSLSGCAIAPSQEQLFQDKNARTNQLSELSNWTIKGKIAFIDPNNKQSANLYWQQNNDDISLKLTTFLGVNVLSVSFENNIYTLKSDDKEWQNENLTDLINQTTGLTLPIESLIYWIKGLKASANDQITYSADTDLPVQLQAWLNQSYWDINYQSYMLVDNYRLANKMTIKHQDLTIKLAIYDWEIH